MAREIRRSKFEIRNSKGQISYTEQRVRMAATKAAEDSRTPRRCRDGARATCSAKVWSAAVLCRFDLRSLAGHD